MIKKIKRAWVEDDTKAGVVLILYGIALVVAGTVTHGPFSLPSFISLVVVDTLGMIPVGAGLVMIAQGIKHARDPRYAEEPEDEPRPRRTHCEDCGKPYVESSTAFGFDPTTGKPNIVEAQHCPDWAQGINGDDPGPCGARSNPVWTNTKPIIHPFHNHNPVEAGKRRTDCPGCLWELVHIGTISQEEADLMAQAFLN